MHRRVKKALEDFFGDDARRINHAREVYSIAMRINEVEGGDRDVVAMAALLHDVGIKPAERLHGSSHAAYQEKLGPPEAEKILLRLGVNGETISSIKEIIASHHTPGRVSTIEFACIWDADMIVNLKESAGHVDLDKIGDLIEKRFMSGEGKRLGREILLK